MSYTAIALPSVATSATAATMQAHTDSPLCRGTVAWFESIMHPRRLQTGISHPSEEFPKPLPLYIVAQCRKNLKRKAGKQMDARTATKRKSPLWKESFQPR